LNKRERRGVFVLLRRGLEQARCGQARGHAPDDSAADPLHALEETPAID
jgi:hypothetical protein